jgi:hypothetical protein
MIRASYLFKHIYCRTWLALEGAANGAERLAPAGNSRMKETSRLFQLVTDGARIGVLASFRS